MIQYYFGQFIRNVRLATKMAETGNGSELNVTGAFIGRLYYQI